MKTKIFIAVVAIALIFGAVIVLYILEEDSRHHAAYGRITGKMKKTQVEAVFCKIRPCLNNHSHTSMCFTAALNAAVRSSVASCSDWPIPFVLLFLKDLYRD